MINSFLFGSLNSIRQRLLGQVILIWYFGIMRRRFLLKAVPCLILLALIIAGLVFLLRAPVLLVTDPSANLLYGESRAKLRQAEISFKLFRRLKAVLIMEDAGTEIIVAAVKAAAKKPRTVFFPYRYSAAAHRYKEENPTITAIILEGRSQTTGSPLGIVTDTEADMFRAGICAAFLAGENEGTTGNGEQGTGNRERGIVVFHDGTLTMRGREAFEKGLLTQGSLKRPLYLDDPSDFPDEEIISCAVILSQGAWFFERHGNEPTILFSWIDPEMTPANVKVIFCDSPWSQVYGALRINNEEKALASELIIPGNRLLEKGTLLKQLENVSVTF
jgi:hypothetical protein